MQPQSPAARRPRPLIQAALLLATVAAVIGLGSTGATAASGQATMRVVKAGAKRNPGPGSSHRQEGPHPLQPQRREERQVHLHRVMPRRLAPAGRARRDEADGPREARHRQATRRQVPGHLPRPAPLQLRRRRKGRRCQRRGRQRRRNLARGEPSGDGPTPANPVADAALRLLIGARRTNGLTGAAPPQSSARRRSTSPVGRPPAAPAGRAPKRARRAGIQGRGA